MRLSLENFAAETDIYFIEERRSEFGVIASLPVSFNAVDYLIIIHIQTYRIYGGGSRSISSNDVRCCCFPRNVLVDFLPYAPPWSLSLPLATMATKRHTTMTIIMRAKRRIACACMLSMTQHLCSGFYWWF